MPRYVIAVNTRTQQFKLITGDGRSVYDRPRSPGGAPTHITHPAQRFRDLVHRLAWVQSCITGIIASQVAGGLTPDDEVVITFPEFLFQSHTGAYRIKPDGTEVGNKAYQLLPQKIECAIKDGLDLGVYGALREYKGIDPNTRIQTPFTPTDSSEFLTNVHSTTDPSKQAWMQRCARMLHECILKQDPWVSIGLCPARITVICGTLVTIEIYSPPAELQPEYPVVLGVRNRACIVSREPPHLNNYDNLKFTLTWVPKIRISDADFPQTPTSYRKRSAEYILSNTEVPVYLPDIQCRLNLDWGLTPAYRVYVQNEQMKGHYPKSLSEFVQEKMGVFRTLTIEGIEQVLAQSRRRRESMGSGGGGGGGDGYAGGAADTAREPSDVGGGEGGSHAGGAAEIVEDETQRAARENAAREDAANKFEREKLLARSGGDGAPLHMVNSSSEQAASIPTDRDIQLRARSFFSPTTPYTGAITDVRICIDHKSDPPGSEEVVDQMSSSGVLDSILPANVLYVISCGMQLDLSYLKRLKIGGCAFLNDGAVSSPKPIDAVMCVGSSAFQTINYKDITQECVNAGAPDAECTTVIGATPARYSIFRFHPVPLSTDFHDPAMQYSGRIKSGQIKLPELIEGGVIAPHVLTPPSGKYTTVWLSSEDREAEYLQKFYSSINTTTNPPTLRRGIELKCNNKTCRNTIFGSFIIDVERKTITCGRCWEVNNYSIHRLP